MIGAVHSGSAQSELMTHAFPPTTMSSPAGPTVIDDGRSDRSGASLTIERIASVGAGGIDGIGVSIGGAVGTTES